MAVTSPADGADFPRVVDSDGVITIDLPCAQCEYNLRMLPVDGVCPECATPISDELVRRLGGAATDQRLLCAVCRADVSGSNPRGFCGGCGTRVVESALAQHLWLAPIDVLETVLGGVRSVAFLAAGLLLAISLGALSPLLPHVMFLGQCVACGAPLMALPIWVVATHGLTRHTPGLWPQRSSAQGLLAAMAWIVPVLGVLMVMSFPLFGGRSEPGLSIMLALAFQVGVVVAWCAVATCMRHLLLRGGAIRRARLALRTAATAVVGMGVFLVGQACLPVAWQTLVPAMVLGGGGVVIVVALLMTIGLGVATSRELARATARSREIRGDWANRTPSPDAPTSPAG